MNRFKHRLALIAALALSASLPAVAASSTASSASDSASTSVGSLSDSVKKSSDSSSKNNDVAEGDYKIIDVATVAEQPGTVRMKLQAVADASEEAAFFLYLPQGAFDQNRLAEGQVVTARRRPYGLEFLKGNGGPAFFLALADDWYRELASHAVAL